MPLETEAALSDLIQEFIPGMSMGIYGLHKVSVYDEAINHTSMSSACRLALA